MLMDKRYIGLFLVKGITILAQLSLFVLLAKYMDVREYAAYVLIGAVSSISVHFIFPGITNLQVKAAVENKSGGYVWYSLKVALLFGLALCLLLMGAVKLFQPGIPFFTIFLFLASEMLFMRCVDIYASALQGRGQVLRAAILLSLPFWIRSMLVIAYVVFVGSLNLHILVAILFISVIVILPGLLRDALAERVEFSLKDFFSDLKNFTWVGGSIIAKNTYVHSDKLIIGHYVGNAAVAEYAICVRLVNLALIPVQNFLYLIYADLFKGDFQRLRRGGAFLLMYSVLASAFVYIYGFDLICYLFGSKYDGAVQFIGVVWVLPILLTLSGFLADIATAIGLYRNRAIVQMSLAVVNVLLNLYAVTVYGAVGAVYVTVVCEVIMAAILLFMIRRKY